jgi:polar amino acid transport system substrate-binding protein
MNIKRSAAGAVVAVLATALAGCGGGSDASTAKAPAVAKDTTLSGAVPAALKNSGVLKVATDATVGVPFATFAQDNKTIVGLDVDLANALAQTLGLKVELVNTPFDGLIPGLQGKRYDVSISTMLDTKKRQATVDFVDFMQDGSGFLVRGDYKGDPVTLEALCGRAVGALRGSFEETSVDEQNAKCDKKIDVKVFENKNAAYLALDTKRIEIFTDALAQINYYSSKSSGKFKAGGEPFGVALIGMALPKESELTPLLQKALQKLMENGEYKAILARNNVADSAITKATVNDAKF